MLADNESNINGFLFTGRPLLDPKKYDTRKRTDNIVIHCADTPASMDIGVKEIRKWHVEERHWSDVGYHYVIRRNGVIERGRPTKAIGAGVAGYNHNSLHICMVGGRGARGEAEDNFTPEQWQTLAFLVGNLKEHVYPNADVLGHRDFPGVTKKCPSFDVQTWFKASLPLQVGLTVRNQIAEA